MNPFFFGTSADPLFGVYHPPYSDEGRGVAVLLCYPMGQEYMRAHRAFRQMALLLSRAGFGVMRFDYFGTGDSAGDSTDISIARWIEDIGTAIDELRETAEVDHVALVGLRMGGTLAALAGSRRDDVCRLVLWDPVVNGADYVKDLLREANAPAGDRRQRMRDESHGNDPQVSAQQAVGVMGFPIPGAVLREIEQIDLAATEPRAGLESLIVVSSNTVPHEAVQRALQMNGGTSTFLDVPSPGDWNEVDDFGSALIPQGIIREIVRYLGEKKLS